MRLLLLIPLVLFIVGCAKPPTTWSVLNATPEQEGQALAMLDAAWVVTSDPHGALARGGTIWIEQKPYGLDGQCPVPPGMHSGGCSYLQPAGRSQVSVLANPGDFLPRLAHELGHVAGMTMDEDEANRLGALILTQYQGG